MNRNKKPGVKKPASEASVMARAKRLARAELKKAALALGLDNFDEAQFQAKIAELRTQRESGMGESEKLASRIKDLETQLSQSRRQAIEARNASARLQKQVKEAEAQKARAQIEQSISDAARTAGVRDSEYALMLFRKHVLSEGPHKQDPAAFFESLKKDSEKAHLFDTRPVGAGVQGKLRPTTDAQTHEKLAPEPKPAVGDEPEKDDVSELSSAEFAKRTREKYGFRPSQLGA